jgi:predicted AAA+ superfamily ATPase
MAVSNRDRVGQAFEKLATGLGPFVDRQMSSAHGQDWFRRFGENDRGGPGSFADPALQLRVLADAWDGAFRSRLGRTERNLVFELRDTRNKWAHNEAFTHDDTYRALDSIERLLVAVDARESDDVGKSKTELMRLRYEAEARRARPAGVEVSAPVAGLRPWREVVVPHDDVAMGRFDLAEFAADLHQVANGLGRAEYSDPLEFFRRTYLTEGLRQLLSEVARRLASSGGVPVIDLQTTFGGGKTHSLIALWHLFSGVALSELPQEVQDLVREAGLDKLPAVRRAALVGTKIAPGQPSVKPDGTEVSTLWGELAWQLGGPQGYARVAQADQSGTSPGEALSVLFAEMGSCLVLVDEWVAYARQLYGVDDRLAGGTFDAHVSFAQALTEAARISEGVALVVSLPASVSADGPGSGGSSVELGGPGGQEALRRLRAVMGRIESSWRPASAEEGFEIVRRRLFQPISADRLSERDAAAHAFAQSYRAQAAEFPTECREPAYERRLRSAYPIHPELFDRLYGDWSTLERFQRTRGVLRLLAQVVGALWRTGDQSPLILPGTVPLDDAAVATELARNLEDSWKTVMDHDVDGTGSLPAQLDRDYPNLGRYGAARRVARTVFIGSAPTTHSPNRGIELPRVRLGCAAPSEAVATFGDALARLSDRATYLYVDRDRYWYGLSPSVGRLARDRAERWLTSGLDEVDAEIVRRLRAERDRGQFVAVHVAPPTTADVDDEAGVRLVVLAPEAVYVARDDECPGVVATRDLLEHRGQAARHHRNAIVFLACDQRRLDDLRQGTAEALAWASVAREKEELGLGAQQAAQAEQKVADTSDAVNRRLAEAYSWALVPGQATPTDPVVLEAVRVEGAGSLYERVGRRLLDKGLLATTYAPSLLRGLVLDGPLSSLWAAGHTSAGDLWEALSRYPYLPRLRDLDVLLSAVAAGPASTSWEVDGFAVADAFDTAASRYRGLVAGSHAAAVTLQSLVVRPATAMRQVEAETAAADAAPETEGSGATGAVGSASGRPEPGAPAGPPAVVDSRPRRFYGVVALDPERLNRDFGRLSQEVVTHLTSLVGTDVEVVVEITAKNPDGFPEAVVRTIGENADALRFRDKGFEPS